MELVVLCIKPVSLVYLFWRGINVAVHFRPKKESALQSERRNTDCTLTHLSPPYADPRSCQNTRFV